MGFQPEASKLFKKVKIKQNLAALRVFCDDFLVKKTCCLCLFSERVMHSCTFNHLCFALAAMQKFNKSQQSDEASPEKATSQSPESTKLAKETSADSAKENVKENGDAAVDSRPTPAGESHEEERDTTTPDVQVNSMCCSLATVF